MFDKIKKAFGFGESHSEEDDSPSKITYAPNVAQRSQTSTPTQTLPRPTNTEKRKEFDQTVDSIFNYVVEQFNKALPGFLQQSTDPQKERQLLYDGLSDDIKAHLENLEKEVREKVQKESVQNCNRQMPKQGQSGKNKHPHNISLNGQPTGVDRDLRSLKERLKEKDKMILTLQAEKEQLQLENKSMINKIKVSQVYEKDIEDLRAYIQHLEEERDGKAGHSSIEHKLQRQIKEISEENTQLKVRVEELENFEQEYNAVAAKMDEVEKHFEKINEITAEKDAKISSYRTKLKKANDAYDSKNSELKKAYEEIERLKQELAYVKTTPYEDKKEDEVTSSQKVAVSDLDDDEDLLNDTDWTVQSKPKKDKDRKQRSERKSSKKRDKRDDGQMSLW